MLKFLLRLLAAAADWFRDRQLIEAGKAERDVEAIKEVERRVEKAQAAAAVDAAGIPGGDVDRAERLRNRFDRARRGE